MTFEPKDNTGTPFYPLEIFSHSYVDTERVGKSKPYTYSAVVLYNFLSSFAALPLAGH